MQAPGGTEHALWDGLDCLDLDRRALTMNKHYLQPLREEFVRCFLALAVIITTAACGGSATVDPVAASTAGASGKDVGDEASGSVGAGESGASAGSSGSLAVTGSGAGASGAGASTAGTAGSADASAAGAAGSADASAAGAAGSAGLSCEQPVAIHVTSGLQTSPDDTGFDRCKDGAIRRRAVVTCPWLPPTGAGGSACQSDADCAARPLGICADAHRLAGYSGCFYGFCTKDADCGAGSVCVCGGPVGGTCAKASCVSDADCGEGSLCVSSSRPECGSIGYDFACQSPADECLGEGDCSDGQRCVRQGNKRSCVAGCPV